MHIPESRLQEVLDRIGLHWPNQTCPTCQGKDISLSPTIFELPEHIDPGESPAERKHVYPVVVMQCRTCGHSLLFSAIALGVDPPVGPPCTGPPPLPSAVGQVPVTPFRRTLDAAATAAVVTPSFFAASGMLRPFRESLDWGGPRLYGAGDPRR